MPSEVTSDTISEVDLDELIAARQEGFSLSQPFYTSEQVFQADMHRVFGRNWLFAGYTCQVRRPGDYFLFEVGEDSLIVICGDDGQVHALFNSCRHRGSRICTQESGHAGKLVCPYHQWVYERNGKLATARWMDKEFDKAQYPLHEAAVEVVEGLIFVCLHPEPPDFAPAREAIGPHIRPHGADRAKLCLTLDYEVNANWKLLWENNRECYHCPVGHPEFCKVNFDVGMPGDPRSGPEYERVLTRNQQHWQEHGLETRVINFPNGSWFRCARMPLREGNITDSLDGQPVAPPLGDLTTRQAGSLRVIAIPTTWFHFTSDYITATQLFPISAKRSKARMTWLVHQDAVEGRDYDPQRVAAFWRIVTEQDWELCENNQKGINCSRYQPGPYSFIAEPGVEQFADWYLRQIKA